MDTLGKDPSLGHVFSNLFKVLAATHLRVVGLLVAASALVVLFAVDWVGTGHDLLVPWNLCLVWILLEAVFFVYQRWMHSTLPARLPLMPADRPALQGPIVEHRRLVDMLQTVETTSVQHFVSGWYGEKTPKTKIVHLEDMRALLALVFVQKPLSAVHEEKDKAQLASITTCFIEGLTKEGCTIVQGGTGAAPCYHLAQDIHWAHLPMVYYTGTTAFRGLGFVAMLMLGFTQRTVSGTRYWHHQGSAATQKPVVLLHGIGVGYSGYLLFLARLLRKGCGPLVVVEMPWIAMQSLEAPPYVEAATSIVQILKTHGYYGQATLLAHSYGTFIVTVLLRRCPGAVAACVFVDPVNFLIFLPNTSQVLIHKTPSTWTTWAAQKLVAHELCTAVTLCRRTWWWEVMLWPEEIHCPSVVVLGQHDALLPATACANWIQSCRNTNVRVEMMPGAIHGAMLTSLSVCDAVIGQVQDLSGI